MSREMFLTRPTSFMFQRMHIIAFWVVIATSSVNASGQIVVPRALAESWLAGTWNEELRVADFEGFILADNRNQVLPYAASFPRVTAQSLVENSNLSRFLRRVSSETALDGFRKQFRATALNVFKGASTKEVDALYVALESHLRDDSKSNESRVACAIALRKIDSVGSLFLPALIHANDLCIEIANNRRLGFDFTNDGLLDAVETILDRSETNRTLAALIHLRLVMAAFKSSLKNAPKSDECLKALSNATAAPVYPFNFPQAPRGSSQRLTTLIKIDDAHIGVVGPFKLTFSRADLVNSFRIGESKSLARTSYSYFMRELLSDVLVFSEREPVLMYQNRKVFRKLVAQCIFSDDLMLGARAAIHYADFARFCQSQFPSWQVEPLNSQIKQGLRALMSNRQFVFFTPIWNYEAIVESNRRYAQSLLGNVVEDGTENVSKRSLKE